MDRLSAALLAITANTPPDSVAHLAQLVRGATQDRARSVLGAWANTPVGKTRIDGLVEAWKDTAVTSAELAGLLIGSSAGYHAGKSEQQIELVWTGPPSSLVATRKTEQALLQVIEASSARLFVTSFVAYDVASILDALAKAIGRGVRVSILLEASEQHGGTISIDAIGKMKVSLPQARLLSWTKKTDGFRGGKVHAKCAVADERICFISSANLTGHAMEKNMEAGLLVTGGATPRSLHLHLDALVTTAIIAQV